VISASGSQTTTRKYSTIEVIYIAYNNSHLSDTFVSMGGGIGWSMKLTERMFEVEEVKVNAQAPVRAYQRRSSYRWRVDATAFDHFTFPTETDPEGQVSSSCEGNICWNDLLGTIDIRWSSEILVRTYFKGRSSRLKFRVKKPIHTVWSTNQTFPISRTN
jgi:hypothetical protein